MQVRESQVEDVLAAYPDILQRLVRSPEELRLIARQMAVPSGRLDLLFSAGPKLLLVELKVEPSRPDFITQTRLYHEDLLALQREQALLDAPINAMLLCPRFSGHDRDLCMAEAITPVVYSPAEVLASFFDELRALAAFVSLRPADHGLWNIHLIHRVLYSLPDRSDLASIAAATSLSPKTVGNHLRLGQDLCLVRRKDRRYSLTDTGERYVEARWSDFPPEHLAEEQASILREVIVKDPFATPTIFGIYSMIDAVFALSRNSYPVQWDIVVAYFKEVCGKRFQWSAAKTAYHGTKMYSNYGIELGLLARVGHDLYLTPDGLRFILLLQLHKSIRMIDMLNP